MELSEAKIRFDAGDLQTAKIWDARLLGGWAVYLSGKSGENMPLESARGQRRVFKTIEAATRVLHDIGFRKITLELDD